MKTNVKTERLNHAIQEEISMILMKEIKDEAIRFVTITGVETTYNYHGNATTTINRKYYGKGTAYIFSSEDEKDEFLENNIPVYSVVNYSNGAIETRLGVGVLIGGICIFLLYLFMELY